MTRHLLPLAAVIACAAVAFAIEPTVKDVIFDDIKLELKKDQPFEAKLLTPKVSQLDGTRVRIRGYMLPGFQQRGITKFVLVRDNMECCFGPGRGPDDRILVEMVEGQSAEFSTRPITVEGTFKVKELKGPSGRHLAIYHLDGEAAK